jgi:hypothetical protein
MSNYNFRNRIDMKKRVLKSWRTSLIGILTFIVASITFFMGKIDTTSYISLLGISATYLVAKDSLLKGITGGIIKFSKK